MRPPTLALVVIARDEARCIRRCLDSARPWVDRMLVLDTGSVDGTPDLARAAGAEVHHRAWADSFAQARNQALELADADWHLVLDADEQLTQGGELLRPWTRQPPQLGVICVHSNFQSGAAGQPAGPAQRHQAWITRLLPRQARFQGRIHEQVCAPLPRRRLNLHVEHDGYLGPQRAGKRERNRTLLLRDLQERPDDPYTLYQLGKEAQALDEAAEASDWFARAWAATPARAAWRHELLVRLLQCLGRAGRREQALELAESQLQAWPHSPDFFFTLGDLLLDQALQDPGRARDHWLPLAEAAWQRCLEIGERPDLDGSVHGRGSHLAEHNLAVLRAHLHRSG